MARGGNNNVMVAYRPRVESNEHFIVLVVPDAYERWRDDKSIPLVDVVGSFNVYFSDQGTQGILGNATKQQLENTFGTHNENYVITQILEKGNQEGSKGIRSELGTRNVAMSSNTVDTRGKSLTGISR